MKTRLTLFFLCALVFPGLAWGQLFWGPVQQQGRPDKLFPRSLVTDAFGNTYVIGSFQGTVKLGPFTLTSQQPTTTVPASSELYVAKYGLGGRVLWTTRLGGATVMEGQRPTTVTGASIALDGQGNCVVTGSFQGTIQTDNLLTISSLEPDRMSILVAQLNSSGVPQWLRRAGGFGYSSSGSAITADAAGNCYVTGTMGGGSAQFDSIKVGSLRNQLFLARYSAAGRVSWARTARSIGFFPTFGNAVRLDGRGNCYVAGNFALQCTLGDTTLYSKGGFDALLACYDARSGILRKAQAFGGTGTEDIKSIDLDRQGNCYLGGTYSAAMQLGTQALPAPPTYQGFLACVTPEGTVEWARNLDTTTSCAAVAVSPGGMSTVAAQVVSISDAGPRYQLKMLQYSRQGALRWAQLIEGTGSILASALDAGPLHTVQLAGSFDGQATLGRNQLRDTNGNAFLVTLFPTTLDWLTEPGELPTPLALQLSPNPAAYGTQVRVGQEGAAALPVGRLVLYNQLGVPVLEHSITTPAQTSIQLDCSSLARGLYVVKLHTTNGPSPARTLLLE